MAEGQFTGLRGRYIYVSDSGREFVRVADETLATVAGSTNAAEPSTGAADGALPSRFKPRGVFWEGVLSGRLVRKFIVCGTLESPLYAADTRRALTIDGVSGTVTGRKGEKQTF
jgi:hypothetical protein